MQPYNASEVWKNAPANRCAITTLQAWG